MLISFLADATCAVARDVRQCLIEIDDRGRAASDCVSRADARDDAFKNALVIASVIKMPFNRINHATCAVARDVRR